LNIFIYIYYIWGILWYFKKTINKTHIIKVYFTKNIKMIILKWKPVLDKIKTNLCKYIEKHNMIWKYVSIIFVWDNPSCKKYVEMKKKFWEEIGINVIVWWQKDMPLNTVDEVLDKIYFCNSDQNCLWILVQLPMFEHFEKYRSKILTSVSPKKDIDWLGWVSFGISSIWEFEFFPATVWAVINLLRWYDLCDMIWKKVSVIWQSNVIWKPIITSLINMWATVFSFNHNSDQDFMKKTCQNSDYIISCTGVVNLIDSSFLNNQKNQVLVDVWRGIKDGIAVWDLNISEIKDKVKAYTPVPGWVWPLTIVSLFDNIRILNQYYWW